MSNLSSVSAKNHIKKQNNNRERDKSKSVASESGSSQCETPPLVEKVLLKFYYVLENLSNFIIIVNYFFKYRLIILLLNKTI